MPKSGFTGISYPFRVNSRGGVTTSTTSVSDATHIVESIRQIFGSNYLERPMEGDEIFSQVSASLFEPNDETMQYVLKSYMVEDLKRLEERIEVGENDIEFTVEIEDNIEYLYATITFKVIRYNTFYTAKIKVGEI